MGDFDVGAIVLAIPHIMQVRDSILLPKFPGTWMH